MACPASEFTRFAAAIAVVFALAGCVTLEETAPVVNAQMVAKAGAGSLQRLETGREVLLESCARCHSLERIADYTAPQWREILNDMGHRSKLSAQEQAALEAYVLAAHAARAFPKP